MWYTLGMDDIQARMQQETAAIIVILMELTGLPSRWSGRIELVPNAEFQGRKRQICDIQLNADLAAQDERWPTLIHESLHSISAGYNANDFRNFRGWEEGVVEQLQRLFRPVLLQRLGVVLPAGVFDAVEASHNFNAYIAALEGLRLLLSRPDVSQQSFYLDLLKLPIKERPDRLVRLCLALEQPQRGVFIAAFSQANALLKTRINQWI